MVTFTGLEESLSMSPVHPTNDQPFDGIARISIILPWVYSFCEPVLINLFIILP